MTDFTHHTPKLLTEADAAADLAGVPRPVSSEEALFLAEECLTNVHELQADERGWFEHPKWGHIPHNLLTDTETMLRALASERDALAVRVRELEAARAGWEVINLGKRPAACDGATSWSCCDTGRCEHDHDHARADASWREFDAALTTPESKP